MKAPLTSLFIRNLFFTILQPGVVAGLIPYLIIGRKIDLLFAGPFELPQILGVILFVPGLFLMLVCVGYFAVFGRGTISPFDPTKHLVVKGPYRFSRNPMYLGVLLMLIGEAFFFEVPMMWLYFFIVFLVFNAFIVFFEEPRLRISFGEQYLRYTQTVRRWI